MKYPLRRGSSAVKRINTCAKKSKGQNTKATLFVFLSRSDAGGTRAACAHAPPPRAPTCADDAAQEDEKAETREEAIHECPRAEAVLHRRVDDVPVEALHVGVEDMVARALGRVAQGGRAALRRHPAGGVGAHARPAEGANALTHHQEADQLHHGDEDDDEQAHGNHLYLAPPLQRRKPLGDLGPHVVVECVESRIGAGVALAGPPASDLPLNPDLVRRTEGLGLAHVEYLQLLRGLEPLLSRRTDDQVQEHAFDEEDARAEDDDHVGDQQIAVQREQVSQMGRRESWLVPRRARRTPRSDRSVQRC